MKYTDLYGNPLHPVVQHIAELCRKYNETSNPEYLDIMRGAINMAHTFGFGVTVFRDKVQCMFLYVSAHDYDTDEVIVMACVENPYHEWYNCQAYMARTKHGFYTV